MDQRIRALNYSWLCEHVIHLIFVLLLCRANQSNHTGNHRGCKKTAQLIRSRSNSQKKPMSSAHQACVKGFGFSFVPDLAKNTVKPVWTNSNT